MTDIDDQLDRDRATVRRQLRKEVHSAADIRAGRADISNEVEALLQKLGFPDKTVVAAFHVDVRDVTVLYYPLNEEGYKQVGGDGYPVTRWRRIQVTT